MSLRTSELSAELVPLFVPPLFVHREYDLAQISRQKPKTSLQLLCTPSSSRTQLNDLVFWLETIHITLLDFNYQRREDNSTLNNPSCRREKATMPPVSSSTKMNAQRLFDNKENMPPAVPKPFEAFSTVHNTQFGRPPHPRKNLSDEERQNDLDQRQKKEANYVVFGPYLEYVVPMRKAISIQWHGLKYDALLTIERCHVANTAHFLWEQELARRQRRCQEATTKWMEDQDIAYQSIISNTKALDKKRVERSNMPHKTTPEYFKRKLDREIYDKKCLIESNQKKLETLRKVDARTIEKQAEDAEMAWKPYDPAENKKKPAAKRTSQQATATRVPKATTGTIESRSSQSKLETAQETNSRKRKNKPTLKDLEAQRAKSNEDQLKAMDGDSEGYSDIDEALRAVDQPSGEMNPSKKRKISPKSNDTPAQTVQVGVARHLSSSGRPLRKAAVKNNVSRRNDDKVSPVPTSSTDTSKSSPTSKKEQSSPPPTSDTSTSSKRKQPSSTDSEEPANKKHMLGHSGNGQRVLGSSYGNKDTDEEDSAYGSQSSTSRRSDRKTATPKSRKSMSPPASRQPQSQSPKRKRVSESDEEESASKMQALEVDSIQVSTPASNGHNLEVEDVELGSEEMVDNIQPVEPETNRKVAVPKSRKNSSTTTPPSASTSGEKRQPDPSDEEQVSHKELSSTTSSEPISESASTHSADTSSMCNNVEEESNKDTKEDEQLENANKGKEEKQAVEESKGDGQNNDSLAPVARDTSEVPSPAPVAAPDVPTKKFSLKEYIAARSGAFEKRKAQVEDIGKANVQQSEVEAQVEEFKSLFEGLGEKVIW